MNISENFASMEFTVAFQQLKSDKALGFVSIFQELILLAGAALNDFYMWLPFVGNKFPRAITC